MLWWRDLLIRFNGVLILDETQRRSIHLFTDASNIGQGGFWYEAPLDHVDWREELSLSQERAFADGWLSYQKTKLASINTREHIAVTTTISTWARAWRGAHLTIYVNNNVALLGLTDGTTKFEPLMDVLRDALVMFAAHDIHITVLRVTSAGNKLADALSRFDWVTAANLCPHWFFPFPMLSTKTS